MILYQTFARPIELAKGDGMPAVKKKWIKSAD